MEHIWQRDQSQDHRDGGIVSEHIQYVDDPLGQVHACRQGRAAEVETKVPVDLDTSVGLDRQSARAG